MMRWADFVVEAFNKPGSRHIRLALSLLFISLMTAITMILFSAAKVILHPNITLWETHAYTILFASVMAPIIALFVLLRFEKLYGKIARENRERERAEEALNKIRANLEKSQEIAHLGSWELDLLNDSLYWSDEVYRIFGLQPQEFSATYDAFLAAVHPDDRAAVDAVYSDSIREGKDSYEIEHRVVRKSTGEVRFVHEKCEHFRDESGRIIRSVGMVHDITERKRSEVALQEAKAQAELYLDLMGHDINNMHQIALGYLELARDMPACEGQAESLDKPIEVLHRSARLIKNVRKLQNLRKGVFRTTEVDVCKVLSDIQQEFGAVPGKSVSLDLNGCEHCRVLANELLHDVFANLVINAIKHTGDQADIFINLESGGG